MQKKIIMTLCVFTLVSLNANAENNALRERPLFKRLRCVYANPANKDKTGGFQSCQVYAKACSRDGSGDWRDSDTSRGRSNLPTPAANSNIGPHLKYNSDIAAPSRSFAAAAPAPTVTVTVTPTVTPTERPERCHNKLIVTCDGNSIYHDGADHFEANGFEYLEGKFNSQVGIKYTPTWNTYETTPSWLNVGGQILGGSCDVSSHRFDD